MIARIAVVGAGLMGHGIAQVFAAAGHPVAIYDPALPVLATVAARVAANLRDLGKSEAAIAEVLARLRLCDTLAAAVGDADFIVEAALEDLGFKQTLFAAIEAAAPASAILASNTSVIPITRIMENLAHRDRALGTHWWNPPFLVPLVEVIGTPWTGADPLQRTLHLHRAIGKTAVHVKRDVPGFIGNRLQHALWREAMALVQNGICDAETVDTVVKASFGRRLGVLGPLENADLVGTDLALAIHQTVLPDLDRTAGPLPILQDLVKAGRLGMKTGQGFREWTPQAQADLRAALVRQLKHAAQTG